MKNRIRKLSEIIAERKKAFFCAVKNVPALFALLLSLAVLFSACQNSSGFDDGFFCIVNGSVYSKDGAESSSSETSARFAMPEPGNLYYTVKGTKDGGTETSDGFFLSNSSGKQEKTFTIKLTEGNWTLNASAYNENSSSLADKVKDENKVLEGSVEITVTKESPVITGTSIPLSPYYGTGSASGSKPTGKISLEISIDSSTSIKGVKTEWAYLDSGNGSSGSGSVTGVPQGKSIEVSSSAVSSTLKIEENNVPVGAYRLSLYFYSNYSSNQATGTLLYYAQEDVNVMNGQTTSVWKATTENAPYLKDENGKTGFKVSADTIKDFRDTVFYVSGTGGYSPKKAASDENQGTYFDPLQTFTQAVSKIKERQKRASSAMTYTVYVSGEVSSAANFSDFFDGSSSSSATVNIESFSGTNGNKGTLKNLDETAARTITTGSLTGKSLYLNFKDLSLSVSGNNNQDGSVINIERGVRVTLDSCTIKDNKVGSKGAVYVNKNNGASADNRAFVVKGATKISGNTTSSNQPANVYLSSGSIIVLDLPTSASQDNINIGVTTEQKPTASNPVQITSRSLGVKASAFTSDEGYTVVKNTGGDNATTNRLELCVSGGTLSAKSIPVIKFEFANTNEGTYYTSKTEAAIKKSEIGSGEGKQYSKIGVSADGASGGKTVSGWNMEIYFHGIKVNTTSASASADSITSVNLDSNWPAGEYQVFVTGTYDGIKYSSVLKLEITDN